MDLELDEHVKNHQSKTDGTLKNPLGFLVSQKCFAFFRMLLIANAMHGF